MRKALLWAGGLLLAAGLIVIGTSVMITVKEGLSPSFNIGDPAKFQFILVPFWAVGAAVAAVGGLCLLGGRRMKVA